MLETYEVIWLTGQPGAGKTSLGEEIKKKLGQKAIIIDGDDIRFLFDNQDYSIPGRRKNVEFVQKLIEFSYKNGFISVVSLVSPFKDLRDLTKKRFRTLEIYVHCDEIRGREHFHVDYYEIPDNNYLDLDTTNKSINQSFNELLILVNQNEFFSKSR